MTVLAPYPQVESCLISHLSTHTSARVAHNTPGGPDGLQNSLPFIAVRRLGGQDDYRSDFTSVDVIVFAATLSLAYTLAYSVQQLLTGAPFVTPHGIVDRVTTELGPHEIPYENPKVVMVPASYRVTVRRRS